MAAGTIDEALRLSMDEMAQKAALAFDQSKWIAQWRGVIEALLERLG
jgi:hypothetical protein